jgi:hypothetical protein
MASQEFTAQERRDAAKSLRFTGVKRGSRVLFTEEQLADIDHVCRLRKQHDMIIANADRAEEFAAWAKANSVDIVPYTLHDGREAYLASKKTYFSFVGVSNQEKYDKRMNTIRAKQAKYRELMKAVNAQSLDSPIPELSTRGLCERAKQARAKGQINGYTPDALRIHFRISTGLAVELSRHLRGK